MHSAEEMRDAFSSVLKKIPKPLTFSRGGLVKSLPLPNLQVDGLGHVGLALQPNVAESIFQSCALDENDLANAEKVPQNAEGSLNSAASSEAKDESKKKICSSLVSKVKPKQVQFSEPWKGAMENLALQQITEMGITCLPFRLQFLGLIVCKPGAVYCHTHEDEKGFATLHVQVPGVSKVGGLVTVTLPETSQEDSQKRPLEKEYFDFSEYHDTMFYAVTCLKGCELTASAAPDGYRVFLRYALRSKDALSTPKLSDIGDVTWLLRRGLEAWEQLLSNHDKSRPGEEARTGSHVEPPPEKLVFAVPQFAGHDNAAELVALLRRSGFEVLLNNLDPYGDCSEYSDYEAREYYIINHGSHDFAEWNDVDGRLDGSCQLHWLSSEQLNGKRRFNIVFCPSSRGFELACQTGPNAAMNYVRRAVKRKDPKAHGFAQALFREAEKWELNGQSDKLLAFAMDLEDKDLTLKALHLMVLGLKTPSKTDWCFFRLKDNFRNCLRRAIVAFGWDELKEVICSLIQQLGSMEKVLWSRTGISNFLSFAMELRDHCPIAAVAIARCSVQAMCVGDVLRDGIRADDYIQLAKTIFKLPELSDFRPLLFSNASLLTMNSLSALKEEFSVDERRLFMLGSLKRKFTSAEKFVRTVRHISDEYGWTSIQEDVLAMISQFYSDLPEHPILLAMVLLALEKNGAISVVQRAVDLICGLAAKAQDPVSLKSSSATDLARMVFSVPELEPEKRKLVDITSHFSFSTLNSLTQVAIEHHNYCSDSLNGTNVCAGELVNKFIAKIRSTFNSSQPTQEHLDQVASLWCLLLSSPQTENFQKSLVDAVLSIATSRETGRLLDSLLQENVSKFVGNVQLSRAAEVRVEQLSEVNNSYAIDVVGNRWEPEPVLDFLRSERKVYIYARFTGINQARAFAWRLRGDHTGRTISIITKTAGRGKSSYVEIAKVLDTASQETARKHFLSRVKKLISHRNPARKSDSLQEEKRVQDDDEIVFVSEKRGRNANTDLPHLRRDCETHRELGPSFCPKCYCCICDEFASKCEAWFVHAYADERLERWKIIKSLVKSAEPEQKRRRVDECLEVL